MPQAELDFAVLLNAHAKLVNPAVLAEVEELVPPDRLFLSHSEEEGQELTNAILDRGFETVFTGGGDGTVVHFINEVIHRAEDAQSLAAEKIPSIGILRLGTGNALAEMVSSGSYLTDLQAFVRNNHRDYHVLPLVEVEKRRFPFAGLGWDAELLNDYVNIKEKVRGTALSALFENVGGYFGALFMSMIPRRTAALVTGHQPRVRIVSTGGEAWRAQEEGSPGTRFESGTLLYEGPANCVMIGTCPYYGYGMKVLPFANHSEKFMQLRVIRLGIPSILANLKPVWEGSFRDDDILDFMVQGIHVEFEEEMPYQEAGDAMGYRREVDFTVSQTTVNLLRFI